MSGVRRLQSNFTLEQTVLHELSKFCWGKFAFKENKYDHISASYWLPKLISYRDEIIRKVPEILNNLPYTSPLTLPTKIIDKVINAVHNLFEGYVEVLKWEMDFCNHLSFTILNPSSGYYEAVNFIDANRHFNDFKWAKTFVADEDQLIHNRFEFACIYCLEEDIISIWNIMKRKKLFPPEGDFDSIRISCIPLLALWAYNLEGKFHILAEDVNHDIYNNGFYFAGIKLAFESYRQHGYGYAIQYFWNHLTETEKIKFYTVLDDSSVYFVDISAHMSNFIYSILSHEQIQKAIYIAEEEFLEFMIWSNLLHSRFYESVLEDILSFSFSVPLVVYGKLFGLLADEIIKKQIPIHKSIFKLIWKRFSNDQQLEILEMGDHIIGNLEEMISLYEPCESYLTVIKSRQLYYYREKAGITAFDEF